MTSPETPVDGGKKLTKGNQPTWAYDLKLDPTTGLRKSEVLVHGGSKSRAVLTTYVHALNYDTLRFVAPDGHAYMWVSNTKVSSVYGSRYDTLRHALFVAAGNIADPLYGHIVADHCFWDGHVNPDGDGVPDEALYVRSSYVDPALVVATLQVLKDWEKHTLRAEKRAHPKAFLATEEEARRCYLGKMSYWKA
ncbi:hypothetical protein BDW02DRAFT_506206 [Decorospora gaudefroyi]|uniref:Uncharacterized protein n=1 Tax=Decorospora gaudefroyi TaxID=184978 RepID=A0A6A5KCE2_9PLEO|nr:hypothetical protein BDW02DRAFT_506206 [Decorospora gaudefroyi]